MSSLAVSNSDLIETGPSQIEGGVPALHVLPTVFSSNHACCARAPREFFHVHATKDGSSHAVLSPTDTALVIERGWGERHGLSGRALGFPLTYIMVYAPRDEGEVAIVCRIAKAAAQYALEGTPVAVWPMMHRE